MISVKIGWYNIMIEKFRSIFSGVVVDMKLKSFNNENGQYNIIEGTNE